MLDYVHNYQGKNYTAALPKLHGANKLLTHIINMYI